MEYTLYQFWRSSASWRVRWALGIKGIAYRTVAVDLAHGDQDQSAHRSLSPMGRVPVLMVGGRALVESVAIFEFLEETVPAPPLYPRDPWPRARVRQLVEVVNAGIQPLQNLAVVRRHSADAAEQKAFAVDFQQRGLSALESMLESIAAEHPKRGDFCVGDTLTAADVFVVPQVMTARRFGADVTGYPRLLAAEAAALATEHARAALPENQPDAPAAQPHG